MEVSCRTWLPLIFPSSHRLTIPAFCLQWELLQRGIEAGSRCYLLVLLRVKVDVDPLVVGCLAFAGALALFCP